MMKNQEFIIYFNVAAESNSYDNDDVSSHAKNIGMQPKAIPIS